MKSKFNLLTRFTSKVDHWEKSYFFVKINEESVLHVDRQYKPEWNTVIGGALARPDNCLLSGLFLTHFHFGFQLVNPSVGLFRKTFRTLLKSFRSWEKRGGQTFSKLGSKGV